MRPIRNVEGQQFGRLTALRRVPAPEGKKGAYWYCRCSCGGEKVVPVLRLLNGATASCGCLARENGRRTLIDLTGQRFGRWVVIGRGQDYITPTKRPRPTWVCRCDCGTVREVIGSNLTSGRTHLSRSCGCLHSERVAKRSTTHGLSHAREYARWWNILKRCHDPKSPYYSDYGGRGITLHSRWHDVRAFLADVASEIGERPSPSHSLDRIDNGRGYEPGNIRWATTSEQLCNRRNTLKLTIGSETKPLIQWISERYPLDQQQKAYSRAYVRMKMGKTGEDVIAPSMNQYFE